eukprot:SAG11_NODE_44469_length_154_cov_347.290909_1_plen_36_part_01
MYYIFFLVHKHDCGFVVFNKSIQGGKTVWSSVSVSV